MKIGIDARFLTHPQPGGFKTYVENLVPALAAVDKENTYVLYLDRGSADDHQLLSSPNFETRVVPGSLPIVGMPWREQVSLSRQAAKDRLDVFHAPCLTAPLHLDCRLVLTVHDMIWAFPDRFSDNEPRSAKRQAMEWYNRLVPRHAARRASGIITVSHAAKESITVHLGLNAERVFVTHEAASPSFGQIQDQQCVAAIRQKYQLPTDFILAIGSADPRKNISTLIEAYSLLPDAVRGKYSLVIVWTHTLLADGLSRKIEGLGLAPRVRFVQQVPTEDLVLLYNAASLFVFPSLYEGFGLPLLEAMACGVPVIAANNSSIPEVVGDAASLFDAHDAQMLSIAITQVLEDESVREKLVRNGLAQAARFSWKTCAGQTISAYENSLVRTRLGK